MSIMLRGIFSVHMQLFNEPEIVREFTLRFIEECIFAILGAHGANKTAL
jgi:Fe-S cluster assembly ATPase SufC